MTLFYIVTVDGNHCEAMLERTEADLLDLVEFFQEGHGGVDEDLLVWSENDWWRGRSQVRGYGRTWELAVENLQNTGVPEAKFAIVIEPSGCSLKGL